MDSIFQMEERRHAPRHPVLKSGKLFCGNFSLMLDCHINNESSDGMHIIVDREMASRLPDRFSLLDRKSGKLVDADVIWRDGAKAGIRFVGKMTDFDHIPSANIRRLSIIGARRL
nr:hypothetical protein [uncultured Cohaesibacter sp.]